MLPLLAAPDDPRIRRPSIARAKLPAVESFNYGRWKLIAYPKRPSEPLRLYDLEADPEERIDRAAEHPIVAATLHQLLRWHHARGAAVLQDRPSSEAPPDFDADLRRRLQELGYIE